MKISSVHLINSPKNLVWQALNNPEFLQQTIPGCMEFTGSMADGYKAVIKQKIGPVSATFHANVFITNIIEGESYRLNGEGDGGVAGFAKGYCDVRLLENGDNTELHYDVDVNIGGKIMQLGSRLIDSVVKNLTDQFFMQFNKKLQS